MTTKTRLKRLKILGTRSLASKGQEALREIFDLITVSANETRDIIHAELENRSKEEREAAKYHTMQDNWRALFGGPSPFDRVIEKIKPFL